MMRIAVCDDEAEALLHNKECVKRELLGRGITEFEIDLYSRPDALLAVDEPYDLIFLDIEMPGANGIETAKRLREKGSATPFVYVTNHSDYAFSAYAVFPLSFATKPIDSDTMRTIMDEFMRRTSAAIPKSVEVLTDTGRVFLFPSDIIYFNCIAKNDIIVVTTGDTLTIIDKFDDLYEKLSKYNFFRIRRDIIINLSHVKSLEPPHKVVMSNETVLNVSHRLRNEFLTALSENVIAEFSGR
jgi:DNA-binding LytR/AlgR family response regulator